MLDKWILRHLGTSYHSSGTCRMGDDHEDSSVVDECCRVLGVDGLQVVDLSILPRITLRPTNATALMLGAGAAGQTHCEATIPLRVVVGGVRAGDERREPGNSYSRRKMRPKGKVVI